MGCYQVILAQHGPDSRYCVSLVDYDGEVPKLLGHFPSITGEPIRFHDKVNGHDPRKTFVEHMEQIQSQVSSQKQIPIFRIDTREFCGYIV